MKTPRIVNAVGHIDDDLIIEASKHKETEKKSLLVKWFSLAACFAVIMIAAAVAVPILSDEVNIATSVEAENSTLPISNESTDPDLNNEIINPPVSAENTNPSVNSEYYTNSNDYTESIDPTDNTENTSPSFVENSGYVKRYFYKVDEGPFSTYDRGKVIPEEKISKKISDVTVTAGWETWIGGTLEETVSIENLRAEVYSIEGISNDIAVALKFIDKGEAVTTTHYYVIMNPDADLTVVEDYIIPRTVYNFYNNLAEE